MRWENTLNEEGSWANKDPRILIFSHYIFQGNGKSWRKTPTINCAVKPCSYTHFIHSMCRPSEVKAFEEKIFKFQFGKSFLLKMYIFIGKFALKGKHPFFLACFLYMGAMICVWGLRMHQRKVYSFSSSITRVFMTLTFKVFRTKFQVLNCLGWKFAKWNNFSSLFQTLGNIQFHKFVSLSNYKVFVNILIGFDCDICNVCLWEYFRRTVIIYRTYAMKYKNLQFCWSSGFWNECVGFIFCLGDFRYLVWFEYS